MTILVLSSTGNTGRATVHALLAKGANVRAASRSPANAQLPAEADVVQFDILDRSTWDRALVGVESLYFCLSTAQSALLEAPLAFITEAAANGVRKIVTLSAFRAEHLTYAPHKKIEEAVEFTGVQWIHLRPNFFAENFLGMLSPNSTLDLPAGDGQTSFISVVDIGAVAAAALTEEHENAVWTLTGPTSIDHAEVASILSERLEKRVQYNDIPKAIFARALEQFAGTPPEKADQLATVYSVDVKEGKYALVTTDVERILGRPAMRFADWATTYMKAPTNGRNE